MAMLSAHHEGYNSRTSSALAITAWCILTDRVVRLEAEWNRRRSQRLLENLPVELRKDIGWPSSDILDDTRSARRL